MMMTSRMSLLMWLLRRRPGDRPLINVNDGDAKRFLAVLAPEAAVGDPVAEERAQRLSAERAVARLGHAGQYRRIARRRAVAIIRQMGKAKKELTNQRRAQRLGTGEGITRTSKKSGGVPAWA